MDGFSYQSLNIWRCKVRGIVFLEDASIAYGRMGVWAYGRMGVWAYEREKWKEMALRQSNAISLFIGFYDMFLRGFSKERAPSVRLSCGMKLIYIRTST